jgi:hypothetical protein
MRVKVMAAPISVSRMLCLTGPSCSKRMMVFVGLELRVGALLDPLRDARRGGDGLGFALLRRGKRSWEGACELFGEAAVADLGL